MNYISEAAKKMQTGVAGLIDGMERNKFIVFEDVDCMPKSMRIIAETISVSYMMLHSHNLGEKIFEEEIKKRQYFYENGIILMKSFLSERGFLSFLQKCEEEIGHYDTTLEFLENIDE